MDNEPDSCPERRKHVRYQYPSHKRPILEIAGWQFPILDICARGLGIQTSPSMGFVEGATVDATIRLVKGEGLQISGTIARQQGPHAGIVLPDAIPQELLWI